MELKPCHSAMNDIEKPGKVAPCAIGFNRDLIKGCNMRYSLQQTLFCNEHNKPICFYCKDCSKPLCPKCTIPGGQSVHLTEDHKVTTFEEMAQENLAKQKNILEMIKKSREMTERDVNTLNPQNMKSMEDDFVARANEGKARTKEVKKDSCAEIAEHLKEISKLFTEEDEQVAKNMFILRERQREMGERELNLALLIRDIENYARSSESLIGMNSIKLHMAMNATGIFSYLQTFISRVCIGYYNDEVNDKILKHNIEPIEDHLRQSMEVQIAFESEDISEC